MGDRLLHPVAAGSSIHHHHQHSADVNVDADAEYDDEVSALGTPGRHPADADIADIMTAPPASIVPSSGGGSCGSNTHRPSARRRGGEGAAAAAAVRSCERLTPVLDRYRVDIVGEGEEIRVTPVERGGGGATRVVPLPRWGEIGIVGIVGGGYEDGAGAVVGRCGQSLGEEGGGEVQVRGDKVRKSSASKEISVDYDPAVAPVGRIGPPPAQLRSSAESEVMRGLQRSRPSYTAVGRLTPVLDRYKVNVAADGGTRVSPLGDQDRNYPTYNYCRKTVEEAGGSSSPRGLAEAPSDEQQCRHISGSEDGERWGGDKDDLDGGNRDPLLLLSHPSDEWSSSKKGRGECTNNASPPRQIGSTLGAPLPGRAEEDEINDCGDGLSTARPTSLGEKSLSRPKSDPNSDVNADFASPPPTSNRLGAAASPSAPFSVAAVGFTTPATRTSSCSSAYSRISIAPTTPSSSSCRTPLAAAWIARNMPGEEGRRLLEVLASPSTSAATPSSCSAASFGSSLRIRRGKEEDGGNGDGNGKKFYKDGVGSEM